MKGCLGVVFPGFSYTLLQTWIPRIFEQSYWRKIPIQNAKYSSNAKYVEGDGGVPRRDGRRRGGRGRGGSTCRNGAMTGSLVCVPAFLTAVVRAEACQRYFEDRSLGDLYKHVLITTFNLNVANVSA